MALTVFREARLAKRAAGTATILGAIHGAIELPDVLVKSYSEDLKDRDGAFFGERVSNGAFRVMLDAIRQKLDDAGGDPIDKPLEELRKKDIDKILLDGTPEQAGVILSAVEGFAQNLANAAKSLLKLRSWSGVQKIVIGGGFRESRVGELVVGRAGVLLKEDFPDVEIVPIQSRPDEAGLIGCAYLAPSWHFEGHDSILAVDIGGSNFRCGVLDLEWDDNGGLKDVSVAKFWLWRHAEEEPARDEATDRLCKMLQEAHDYATRKARKLAPFIGIGCPGTILADGKLSGGILNLPGNWGAKNFNLVQRVVSLIPRINNHQTVAILHNDAVVQGLSELPRMRSLDKWAVMTIGTGLGNACFQNKGDTPED